MADCREELSDHGQQTGVEQGARRTLHAVEVEEQLMTADDGAGEPLAQHLCRAPLDHAAVAHGVHLHDADRVHIAEPAFCVRTQHIPIRLTLDLAGKGGFAVQMVQLVRGRQSAAGLLRTHRVDAEQQQLGAAALLLDAGIGRKRGGQRYQRDFGRVELRQPVHGAADALREIVLGGQMLCRRAHRSAVKVIQHGICIRAARVDSDSQFHGSSSRFFVLIILCRRRRCPSHAAQTAG